MQQPKRGQIPCMGYQANPTVCHPFPPDKKMNSPLDFVSHTTKLVFCNIYIMTTIISLALNFNVNTFEIGNLKNYGWILTLSYQFSLGNVLVFLLVSHSRQENIFDILHVKKV